MDFRRAVVLLAIVCLAMAAGCASPSKANNKLREENLKLQEQIETLQRERAADKATVEALQSKIGTIPTLPQERLEKLFTVHGIQLGRLTGGEDWDSSQPGDDGIKVALVPIDQDGQKLKAAGSITVDAFDLTAPDDPHVGHWAFDVQQARKSWFGNALLYSYVLRCPWQKVPTHKELTVRVTFTDELTGREFTEQKVCKINSPRIANSPTTRPASRP